GFSSTNSSTGSKKSNAKILLFFGIPSIRRSPTSSALLACPEMSLKSGVELFMSTTRRLMKTTSCPSTWTAGPILPCTLSRAITMFWAITGINPTTAACGVSSRKNTSTEKPFSDIGRSTKWVVWIEKDRDAAAGRWASFSRQRTRLRRRGCWGSRFQYFDDGLSGNPHGPVLRRSDRDDDVSPDRQHRNQP